MPRSGSGWTRESAKGTFTQRAYCPTCTRLVLERPEPVVKFAFHEMMMDMMEASQRFEDLFCSDQCMEQFIEKWRKTLRRICKKEESINIGVTFLIREGSIPEQLGDIVANLEDEKEETSDGGRDSSPARGNSSNTQNKIVGADGTRGISFTSVILDDTP